MKDLEKRAFKRAYQHGVAGATPEEVEAFLIDYFNDKNSDDLYQRHECYTSVVDAICVWDKAIEFATKEPEIQQLRIDIQTQDGITDEMYKTICKAIVAHGGEVLDDGNAPYTECMKEQYKEMQG